MKTEPITYKFTTFQQLVDRVPADKIEECMMELARVLSAGKLSCVAVCEMAGISPIPEQLFLVPDEFEWMDDGKGELIANMQAPNGENIVAIDVSLKR
jgi:hypothetical protein